MPLVNGELTERQHKLLRLWCLKNNVTVKDFVLKSIVERMRVTVYADPEYRQAAQATKPATLVGEHPPKNVA